MSTLGMVQLLFVALALVMAGLGLALRVDDFRLAPPTWRGLALALVVQMALLPALALGIVTFLSVSPPLAIGLMLLAATPASISTNLYSHLFGGNVAFNVTLTGLNTVLCALTLPFICGWSLGHFGGGQTAIPLLFDKALETVAIVFIPVIAGMVLAARAPRFAARIGKPVKIASAVVVVVFSVAAIVKEWQALRTGFAQVGSSVLLLNAGSMAIGWGAARLAGLGRRETITIAFQASIHNALLAIYVAMVVLQDPVIALPAAVYSITMNLFGVTLGLWLGASSRRTQPAGDSTSLRTASGSATLRSSR